MSENRPAGPGRWTFAILGVLLGILIGGGAMYAASGRFVRSYLLANPEVLPEAMAKLEASRASAAVDGQRSALETPYHGAWAGAADGDVVLVEFFDYACGYCRSSNPDVERLLDEDDKLKVVWREFPVLGPDSEQAAVDSLAAAKANRFRPYFDALFAAGRPTAASRSAARAAAGLPSASLTDEMRAEIAKNYELARGIGATGTPTFVVGDQVLQGAVGYEALKQAIADARAG